MEKWVFVIVKAAVVRLVFFVYSFIATWRVVETYGNSGYWWMLFLLVGILAEAIVTFYGRKGEEWQWFSPAIFFYLLAALPAIWLLELHLMDLRHQASDVVANRTNVGEDNDLFGIQFQVSLDEFGWALALEQALFCSLILSRWVLPRGEVSRNQLSQLLLVQIGMAADIMELFEVFEESKILQNRHLVYPLLSLWTLSLLQYCLVITATKARKDTFGGMEDDEMEAVDGKKARCSCHISDWNADVVGILTTIFMQDLPFFVFRVYLLGGLQMVSHMMVFFTCKNTLVIILQVYRLVTIYIDSKKEEDEPKDISSTPTTVRDPESTIGNNRISPTPDGLDDSAANSRVPHHPNGVDPSLNEKKNSLRRSKRAFENNPQHTNPETNSGVVGRRSKSPK